jgi:hypothetical protein
MQKPSVFLRIYFLMNYLNKKMKEVNKENFRLLFLCFFFLFEMVLLCADQLLMKHLAGLFYLFTSYIFYA